MCFRCVIKMFRIYLYCVFFVNPLYYIPGHKGEILRLVSLEYYTVSVSVLKKMSGTKAEEKTLSLMTKTT